MKIGGGGDEREVDHADVALERRIELHATVALREPCRSCGHDFSRGCDAGATRGFATVTGETLAGDNASNATLVRLCERPSPTPPGSKARPRCTRRAARGRG